MAQRWVAAVLRHETNTFSPIATPIKDFGRVGPTDGPARGEDTFRFYRNTNNPVAAYIDLAEEAGVELDFPFAGNAHPSAPAPDEILDLFLRQFSDPLRRAVLLCSWRDGHRWIR